MCRPLFTFLYKLPQFLAIALDFSISYCTFVNKICSRTMPIKRKSRWQQNHFKLKELTKSLGNGDALKDRNERDDDNRGPKPREHAAKGNHLILNII